MDKRMNPNSEPNQPSVGHQSDHASPASTGLSLPSVPGTTHLSATDDGAIASQPNTAGQASGSSANPKRSKPSLAWLIVPLLLGVCTWQGWRWWSWVSAPVQPAVATAAVADKTVQIQILPGTSVSQMGRDLEAAGLIRSATAWNIWARWLSLREKVLPNQQGEFHSGTFELSPTQPLSAIAQRIWRGEVVQRRFVIPEGWSLQQMADYFQSQGLFKAADFLQAVQQPPFGQYPWLPTGLPHLEGFLYPDTYYLPDGPTKPESIITMMLNRFEQVALPIYEKHRQQTKLSFVEWVTLASIVEKESVLPEERARIAGVFTRRLKLRMPLGADPTVEYGLGIRQTPDQPLTLSQVNTPSPYNTYLNPGLPPTPIASPGQASLEASIQPEDTDYLYFVARYDGSHVFSRTLAEHETAQEKIRAAREARPSGT